MERDLNRIIMRYRNLKENSTYPYEIKEKDSHNAKNRKKAIKEEFENFKTNLSKSKFNSYFELEDFVDGYVAEIRELWKKENRRITVGA